MTSLFLLLFGPIIKSLNAIQDTVMSIEMKVDTHMSEADAAITELTNQLTAISADLSEGFTEVTAKITELEAQVASGDPVDPAVVQALKDQVATLAGQATAIADIVPDAPVEEPPVEE